MNPGDGWQRLKRQTVVPKISGWRHVCKNSIQGHLRANSRQGTCVYSLVCLAFHLHSKRKATIDKHNFERQRDGRFSSGFPRKNWFLNPLPDADSPQANPSRPAPVALGMPGVGLLLWSRRLRCRGCGYETPPKLPVVFRDVALSRGKSSTVEENKQRVIFEPLRQSRLHT